MTVKIISITPDAEKTIAFICRVSNPKNQSCDSFSKLIQYCIKHKHWSVFEQGSLTVEIITTRAISAQLIRHRSFCFQEFSQRYAKVVNYETPELRKQDVKNRQNSIVGGLDAEVVLDLNKKIDEHLKESIKLYEQLLEKGVAKECARGILPMCSTTKIYMSGNIRNFIHYIELRCGEETQREHRIVAEGIKRIFVEELPVISEALGWSNDTTKGTTKGTYD